MKLSTPFQNSSQVQSRFQNVAFRVYLLCWKQTKIIYAGGSERSRDKICDEANRRSLDTKGVFWNHLCVLESFVCFYPLETVN